MSNATELLRKGATLLKEPCSNCGNLQLRYKNKILCINCNDISNLESLEIIDSNEVTSSLMNTVNSKVQKLSKALEKEEDVEKQTRMANLLLVYMKIIETIKKPNKINK